MSQSSNTPEGKRKVCVGGGGNFQKLISVKVKSKERAVASGLRTLSQVEDGPGHLQPLVSVRHLQRVQQPHDVGPLLLHRQLDPPSVSSCRKDTATPGATIFTLFRPQTAQRRLVTDVS